MSASKNEGRKSAIRLLQAAGAGLLGGVVFCTGILAADLSGLCGLLLASESPAAALAMLYVPVCAAFAGLSIGMAPEVPVQPLDPPPPNRRPSRKRWTF